MEILISDINIGSLEETLIIHFAPCSSKNDGEIVCLIFCQNDLKEFKDSKIRTEDVHEGDCLLLY